MFQRLQSIYLVVALLAQGALYYFPSLGFVGPNQNQVKVTAIQVTNSTPLLQNQELSAPLPLALIAGIGLGLIFTTLLGYRNRKKQMQLALAALFSCVVFMITSVIFLFKWHGSDGLVFTPAESPAFLIPVANVIFILLAYRGIKKDEDLVRSVDRIR